MIGNVRGGEFRAWIPAALAAGALLVAAAPASAELPVDPKYEAVAAKSQLEPRLGAHLPLGAAFQDENGGRVAMRDLLPADRPVILAIIYYTCPVLCNEVMKGLVAGLAKLDWNAGSEFDVVVLSMDPRDTPAESLLRKEHHVGSYGRRDSAGGWHFLTGAEPEIRSVADAVGFRYIWQEDKQEFGHPAGLFFVTSDGRLARCLPGVRYEPDQLKLALVEAGEGKIGTFFDQLSMLCISWDPQIGRYSSVAFNVMRGGAVLIVAGMATLILYLRRLEKKRGQSNPLPAGSKL